MTDIHLHLEGSVSPETFFGISRETGLAVPDNLTELIQYNSASNEPDGFRKCFELPLSFMRSPDNVRYAVMKLAELLVKENTKYAEVRITPQIHTSSGYTQEQILLGALEGLKYASFIGTKIRFILCLIRGGSEKNNIKSLELGEKYFGRGVCALDLCDDGSEYSVDESAELFEYAHKKGIRFTIHAGRNEGPESIWKALRLGASRIGYGLSAAEDPELLKYLSHHKIPLELCPTGSIMTGAVKSLNDFPLMKFLDAGVICTVNTDHRTVFNTTLPKELNLVRNAEGVTDRIILRLKANAEAAAFDK